MSDIVRGWVRNQERRDDPRVWFLCGACLNREPFLRWTARGPSLRFYGRDRRYVSPDQAETRELLNERLSVGD